jgi:hypothetical protein
MNPVAPSFRYRLTASLYFKQSTCVALSAPTPNSQEMR